MVMVAYLFVAVWLTRTGALFAGIRFANRVLSQPRGPGDKPRPPAEVIPPPGTLDGAGIVALIGLADTLLVLGSWHASGTSDLIRSILPILPLLFATAAGLVAATLPTTFARACLVVFFQWLVFGLVWAALFACIALWVVANGGLTRNATLS